VHDRGTVRDPDAAGLQNGDVGHTDHLPRFTVVLPVRDRAASIGRAVTAVLAQTFADFELIVVDLGSADRTVAAVRAVADHRVRIIEMDDAPPVGPAPAVLPSPSDVHTAALDMVRSDWCVLVDPDVEVGSAWLARLGRLIDRTGAKFVSCGGIQLDDRGGGTEVRPAAEGGGRPACLRPGAFATTTDRLRAAVGLIGPDLALRNHPAGSAHRVVDPAGPATHFGRAALDFALLEGATVAHSPELLVTWHEPMSSDSSLAEQPDCEDELHLRLAYQGLDALARTPIPDGELLARYAAFGGVAAARLNQRRDARRLFRIACRAEPEVRAHWGRLVAAHLGPIGQRAFS